ncbi:MAG TPA: hypothetical protein VIT44_07375, partial [Cyclobacteriaceae bacterium]
FGDRLDLIVNVNGDVSNKFIPPLLLLPFVENSFKHGTSQMEGLAWMSMDILIRDEELTFKLVNGKPEGPDKSKVLSSGIGLTNVKKRLSLLYPDGFDLRIKEDDSTFIVSLNLQLSKVRIAG